MFSHVKQEELHNKSSVVQRSLLVVSYSGPSSVSVGGLLCVSACIYVAEFNRVGLWRKSVLNRVELETLLTNTVETTMWKGFFYLNSFKIMNLCLSHLLQSPRHTTTVCEGSFSVHSRPNLSGYSSKTALVEWKCYLDTSALLLELPTLTVSTLSETSSFLFWINCQYHFFPGTALAKLTYRFLKIKNLIE